MSGRLVLSPRHGVNPALMLCFVCGKEYGVALMGLIRGTNDREAPRHVTDPNFLCTECETRLKGEIAVIEVNAQGQRTGYVAFLGSEFAARLTPETLRRDVERRRMAFVDEEFWNTYIKTRREAEETTDDGPTA